MYSAERLDVIFNKLKASVPEVSVYEGFGYCGYCSQLLSNALNENKINNSVILGEYLSDSEIGNKCKKEVGSLILSFPNDNSVYSDIKKHYIDRGSKLPSRTGHAVVLIDEMIYDITSGQFGLPNIYTVDKFKDIWKILFLSKISINEKSLDTFKIEKISKRKLII